VPLEPLIEEDRRRCPQCEAEAGPEQDGEYLYYSCGRCGADFGYQRVPSSQPTCAAGLPAEAPPASAPVFIADTIRRRPG